MTRNTIACLESWADELLSRALRVRNLIGDAHWLSDGHHKEELVREYLVRHLPQSLRVSRGFVCSTDPATRVSPEVDVLITDQESELPWFAEGGLIIVPPSAACGQIHVKTELKSKEITDVLEAIFNTCESCEPQRDPSHIWSGAIFFAHSECESDDDYSRVFSAALTKYLGHQSDRRRKLYLPDCIAIVDGPVITTEKARCEGSETQVEAIRMFTCGRLSVAVLLNHFYDALIERGRNLRKRGEWTQLIQEKSYRVIFEQALNENGK